MHVIHVRSQNIILKTTLIHFSLKGYQSKFGKYSFSFTFSGHKQAQNAQVWTGLIGPMQGAIPAQSHNP